MFMRESEGVYQFGTKRVSVKCVKDKIEIRVGGGFLSLDEFLDQYWCEIGHNDCPALKEWRAGLFECDVGCAASGGKIQPGSNQCDHGADNEDCLFPVILNEGKENERVECDSFCGPNSGILEDWATMECRWTNFEFKSSHDGFFGI